MSSTLSMIGYTTFTFAMSMVPLIVLQVIFNMAPFWTNLIDWFYLKEYLTMFELVALILSFIGVLLITFSSPNSSEDSPKSVTGL